MTSNDKGGTTIAAVKAVDPLEKEGWLKRSILDEPRLSEVVAMYKELGLEVKIVGIEPGQGDRCTVCMDGTPEKYKIVYTREMKV